MTHPSYRRIGKLSSITYPTRFAWSSKEISQPKEISYNEISEIADKLISGKEAFLVWVDVVGEKEAKDLASKTFPRILQTLPSLIPKGISSDKYLDVQAKIFLTIGDLCLNHNVLTISATKHCLDIALLDLAGKSTQKGDANIRYSEAVGILIAKLANRLKYSNSYKPLDKNNELDVTEKLKNLSF